MAVTILSMESARVPSQSKIRVFMSLLSQTTQGTIPDLSGLGTHLQALTTRQLGTKGNCVQKQALAALFSNHSGKIIITVLGISGNRVAGMTGMHTDLVGAPGNRTGFHQGGQ